MSVRFSFLLRSARRVREKKSVPRAEKRGKTRPKTGRKMLPSPQLQNTLHDNTMIIMPECLPCPMKTERGDAGAGNGGETGDAEETRTPGGKRGGGPPFSCSAAKAAL